MLRAVGQQWLLGSPDGRSADKPPTAQWPNGTLPRWVPASPSNSARIAGNSLGAILRASV